ncbi:MULTISPECIES: metallophosphoesterase [unclassified Synechococcus]|uniref:metallophosphoesterase n=1 Tax=unclassified Synechococcus TaxID=2626047 RepID=UPI0000698D6B|nr:MULTISPECIES: metallophosphoesterase [unclassified Synechococcus]EAQ74561.1 putative purple acid phosphatase [Synechococcus sp. WH 5701]WFN58532.1 metallophosphoesterase [Synechococcus sp. CCFWC 502]
MDTRRLGRRELLGLLLGGALAGTLLLERQSPGQAATPAKPEAARLHWLAVADTGGGNEPQRAVGRAMAAVHRARPVDLVVLAGDNIYPKGDISQVKEKFTIPYKALLTAGVPFHAVLGNHDIRTANGDPQIAYRPFGMKGRWYTLARGPVEFFMLDSNVNADWGRQLPWLKRALAASQAPWKVVVAHHPIQSSGHYGNNEAARARLAPLFRQFGVQLYINGHEHNYERSKPINGTTYLVVGGGGAYLRPVTPGPNSARAISAHSFAELTASNKQLLIQAWDSKGQSIDRAAINPAGQLIKP